MAAERSGGMYGSAAATEGWRRGATARAQFLGPVTKVMLDLAGLRPGARVLDVGAGTGEQTLMAARRVGPTGSILATDVAASMLAVAAEGARQAGLSNVVTRVVDARDLDVEPDSFDAAIARLALMLIPERERVLNVVRRSLKPGGKFAMIVFSSADKNPLTALTLSVAHRHAGLPPPPVDPGLFALGDSEVLRAALEGAGFRHVEVRAVPTVRRFSSVEASMQYRMDAGPEVRQLIGEMSEAARVAALTEIETAVRQFAGPDGVGEPGEYLVGVGSR
jgi:ubiquinone/menaquinone biosynthesis C-methylase UbiE